MCALLACMCILGCRNAILLVTEHNNVGRYRARWDKRVMARGRRHVTPPCLVTPPCHVVPCWDKPSPIWHASVPCRRTFAPKRGVTRHCGVPCRRPRAMKRLFQRARYRPILLCSATQHRTPAAQHAHACNQTHFDSKLLQFYTKKAREHACMFAKQRVLANTLFEDKTLCSHSCVLTNRDLLHACVMNKLCVASIVVES